MTLIRESVVIKALRKPDATTSEDLELELGDIEVKEKTRGDEDQVLVNVKFRNVPFLGKKEGGFTLYVSSNGKIEQAFFWNDSHRQWPLNFKGSGNILSKYIKDKTGKEILPVEFEKQLKENKTSSRMTPKEKQLTVNLLIEKIQRLSGKKVVFEKAKLKTWSEGAIKQSLKQDADQRRVAAKAISVDKVVNYIEQSGSEFKANFTGAWDGMRGAPKKITVNVGRGFEDAIAVKSSNGGHMIYVGPYKLGGAPTEDTMFTFYCESGLFIKGL